MENYQRVYGLPVTGTCDQDTLAQMKQNDFDFVAEAKKQGPRSLSSFCQPSGMTWYWGPGIMPASSREKVVDALLDLQHSSP